MTEPQHEPRDIFLEGVQPKIDLLGVGSQANAVKDRSPSRAGLVDGGCHSLISKSSGRVLKATDDQMILMHVWRIPCRRIGVNMLNERPEEAMGVYAKDDCSIPAGMRKYIPVQTNRGITGEVLMKISDKTIPG